MTLDQALDTATQLSMKQQKQLINILRRRHIEKRREDIAQHARESMAMVQSGQLKPQPFPDILKELFRSYSNIPSHLCPPVHREE